MKIKELLKLLIFPLIVGLIVCFFQFKLNQKNIELSYFDSRNKTASPVDVNNTSLLIDNDLNKLSVALVSIKNTGKTALHDINIRIKFNTVSSDFKILKIYHRTNPQYDFGTINENIDIANNSVQVHYELINPNDIADVQISLTGNYDDITLFSKSDNLKITKNRFEFEPYETIRISFFFLLIILSFAIGVLIYYNRLNKKFSNEFWDEMEKALNYYNESKEKGLIK